MPKRHEHEKHKKGEMTVQEAGHLGGQKTAETHGEEFYSEIGHKGGEIGGNVVKKKYGPEHFSEIGHKGGQRVKELIEKAEEAEKQEK
ncbi:MAG TPA: general stress protein [Chroococcales cyanobacterium]